VIVQGLGAIGAGLLRAAHADARFEVVGAVDVAPALAGRLLAELTGSGPARITVKPTLEAALAAAPGAEVLLHATGSKLHEIAPHLEDAIRRGLHVVSTCEELSWPWDRHPDLARRLHEAARVAGRTLLGTGVNPGFVMDRLAVTVASASCGVRGVSVWRLVDPRPRRPQFQKKVGFGLERDDWEALVISGRAGHIGLPESARLVAAGLGWTIPHWTERFEPLVPDPEGPISGILQVMEGATADGRTIRLRFEAHAGITRSEDRIDVDGTPPVHLRIDGGVSGDAATHAAVLHAAHLLGAAPRGLVTVLDLPLR
jgi:4-hydroxy-tetrahydrodipicolinate reductase